MNKIFGAIAADVIDSTSLSRDDLLHLSNEVDRCFSDAKFYVAIKFWGRLVKGDSIECCLQCLIIFSLSLLGILFPKYTLLILKKGIGFLVINPSCKIKRHSF